MRRGNSCDVLIHCAGISTDVLFGAVMAVENKMVTATLWQVPNQPIVFAQDPTKKERSEDAAVAFTWLEFMFHKDRDDFVLFFPMVKSVHSALTAIQQYTQQTHEIDLQKFVVAGASKRGWTTWLEGATDDRVIAIVPIVMDMLYVRALLRPLLRCSHVWPQQLPKECCAHA